MRPRSGFVLLAALVVLASLSAACLDGALRARAARLRAQRVTERAEARAAASAGLTQLLLRLEGLLAAREGEALVDPWARADTLRLDATLPVRVRDAGSALHLNHATEAQLAALFAAHGVSSDTAQAIAQVVLDWSDGDDAPRARGAEAADYRDTGAFVRPANTAYTDERGVVQTLGFPAALHAAVADLTVLGPGRVNINAAPLPVLLSLPGMSAEAAQSALSRRARGERFMHPAQLADDVSVEARDRLLSRLSALMDAASVETTLLDVRIAALAPGGEEAAVIRALVQRTGERAFVRWLRVE